MEEGTAEQGGSRHFGVQFASLIGGSGQADLRK